MDEDASSTFGFPCCSTREGLCIGVSITIVGLILAKPGCFLFSGYGQTDGHDFGILIGKHVGTQKISTQSSINSTQSSISGVSCRSLYASPDAGDA